VSVVLGRVREKDDAGIRRARYYVLDMVERQVSAPQFALVVRSHQIAYPGAPTRWYAAGAEKGIGDFLEQAGVDVEVLPATADKFVRAQPVAAAWNRGDVLVPRGMPWAQRLVSQVTSFTGLGDKHDDIVDALAAAYDQIADEDVSEWSAGVRAHAKALGIGR
jgi:predicted phage terminase large subunit-like protein